MRCASLSVTRLGPPYRRLCQFRLEPSSHRPRWRPDGSFVLRLERVAFLCPQSIARLVVARKRTNGQCPNGRGEDVPNGRRQPSHTCLTLELAVCEQSPLS